ncbi:MAG: PAS domain-containing hybrid sensor histidine kinase/response regulator, partial [bacterium]
MRDGGGSITHFVGVMHDITERRIAEEQLRESEQRFRQIAETIRDVFFIQEPTSSHMFYVSPAYEEIWGRTCESLYEQPASWAEHIHPDDRAYAYEQFTAGRFTGFDYEYRIVRPDGDIRWIRARGFPVLDNDGKPYRTAGVAADITEHKQAQDELRDSERRFREILDNLELISVMLDRDARVTYCNDYFLRVTGWQREDVIGTDWFERFAPPELAGELREAFASLVAAQTEIRHYTNEIIIRSGKRRLIQWNNSLIYSASGEVIGTASIAEDITDRTRMEQQLLRTQRLESLGTLAGGIAHDLNNLLLPILMGVTLLRRFEPNEPSMKAIENIERSVRRGRDLVKQVLLFARGSDSTRQLVQLGDVVREVKSIADSTFPKDVTFEILIDDDLNAAMGDATQLVQVLLNLCVNARDAMPHGGQISISVTNAEVTDHDAQLHGGLTGGPYVVMEVADTGEGMSKEIIDRIFDPFFTTKDIGKGTGLGLSTVQGIVNSHGGFLDVSSLTGEGSTFTVSLPALPSSPESTATSGKAGKSPHGNGELILVVDDDAAVVSMTKQTLEIFGYEVLTAEDGAQAIGVFSRRHSDIALVLTDMSMPIIDGPALIAALNRISPNVRIIATTGNLSAAYITRITKTGVTHILTKPYTAGRLLRT